MAFDSFPATLTDTDVALATPCYERNVQRDWAERLRTALGQVPEAGRYARQLATASTRGMTRAQIILDLAATEARIPAVDAAIRARGNLVLGVDQ